MWAQTSGLVTDNTITNYDKSDSSLAKFGRVQQVNPPEYPRPTLLAKPPHDHPAIRAKDFSVRDSSKCQFHLLDSRQSEFN